MAKPQGFDQQGRPANDRMFYDDVKTLSLAGYLLSDDRSAKHAALLLRTWFLDRRLEWNPHLRYGQAIQVHDGRGSGIIGPAPFIRGL